MLVKVDQKWRIRLPKKAREALKLENSHQLELEVKDGVLAISKPSQKRAIEADSFLRDMIERPLKSKVRITRELLEQLEDEQWSGL